MTYRDDVEGIDASILMHPRVWEASGHVEGFNDPMVEDSKTNERFRLDHLLAYEDRHLLADTQCNGIGRPAVDLKFPSIMVDAQHRIEGALEEFVYVDALEFPGKLVDDGGEKIVCLGPGHFEALEASPLASSRLVSSESASNFSTMFFWASIEGRGMMKFLICCVLKFG